MSESLHANLGRWLWAAVAVATLIVVFAGGYVYYRFETSRIRQEKYHEIAAIGKLKAEQIEQWRRQRLSDVQRLSHSPLFGGTVRELLRDPGNTALRAKLQARLELAEKTEGYSEVLLLDSEMNVVMSVQPLSHPLGSDSKQIIQQALAGRNPILSDLHIDPNNTAVIDAAGPVLAPGGRAVAVLLLTSRADSHLFPLVESWPVPSRSGKTVLVRRDGDDVLFLNDPGHANGSGLLWREPLTRKDLPAVQAVLGKQGIFEGIDSRGAKVLADLRPIIGSPWFLVTQMNASDVMAEALYRGAIIVLFASLFVVLAASVAVYASRSRQVRLYRDLYRSERARRAASEELEESQRRAEFFAGLVDKSSQPVSVGRLDGRIETANEAFCKLIGYSKEELSAIEWSSVLTPPEWLEITMAKLSELQRTSHPIRYQKEYIRKDGTRVPVDLLVHLATDEMGAPQFYYAFVTDITEFKRTEAALRASEMKLSNAMKMAHLGYWEFDVAKDRFTFNDEFYAIFRTSAEEVGGYTMSSAEYAQRFVPPEERYIIEDEIRQCVEADDPNFTLQLEHRMVYADGELGHINVQIFVVKDDLGRTVHIHGVNQDITDRKRTEEAIRQSERRFRSLFENMLEAFAYCRMLYENGKPYDFVFLDINDAFEKLTGLRNIVGKRATEVIPAIKDSNPELFEIVGGVAATGTPAKFEIHLGKLGIWVSISAYSTDMEYFVVVFDNITERKRSEKALRDSEERFRVLANGAFEGVLISRDAIILDANMVFCDKLGYGLEELIGMNIRDIVADEFREITLKNVFLWSEETYETAFVRKNGEVFSVQVKGKTIPYEGGSARIASVRDITAAKKAEEIRRRLATAIEQSAEAVLITDTKGVIHYVNPAMERITGFSSEDLLGKTPAVFKSGQHDHGFYKQLWDVITGGRVWSGRLVNKKQDGNLYHADVTISPVRNTAGQITDFVAVEYDVTERLQLTSQLAQAQKMEAVGTLAGGVAHDFNNLLQIVLGYSELVLSEVELPSRFRDDLARINQAARNGADLVQRLLTFSRKTEARPRPLNLNKQIEQLQKMLSRTIPKMIEIRLNLAEDLVAINADPTQIEQVLMNLAVNARDAMPEGGCLTISTENIILDESYAKAHLGAKPGHYVLLSVSDTGQGMDKQTCDHIFEPFFTTKAPGEGTGLGLAMVYGIIQQHGGHINCYSEIGQGTVFRMYFPSLAAEEEMEQTETKIFPRGGSETILLVDDEKSIRELGQRMLTKAGYKIIEASNGKEALHIYKNRGNEISLVILDLIMPEMAGTQCLQALQVLDPAVKVVIASGYAANGTTKEILTSTGKKFIRKPYEIREVLEIVRDVLDEKPPRT